MTKLENPQFIGSVIETSVFWVGHYCC